MKLILAFLLMFPLPKYSAFDEAKKLCLSNDYEASLVLLTTVQQNRTNYNEYCYLMAVNNFALNRKDEASKWIKNLSDSFEPLTRRHAALLYLMEEDIKNWDNGDLSDIARDMTISADRLVNGRGGETTQKIQKQIVDKLEKLIKEQENKEAAAKAKAEAAAKGNQELPGPGQEKSNVPGTESIIMGGKGDGKVNEKVLRDIAASWGTMPAEKRAKVVLEMTRDLPPKFEVMIKNYFEALNKMYDK